MRKNLFLSRLVIVLLGLYTSSCEAIGGIFKAGVWSGVLLVVGVIALIIFIISRVGGKK
jgi:TRAP-type C4-dicarboxylate transport system permease large subunit